MNFRFRLLLFSFFLLSTLISFSQVRPGSGNSLYLNLNGSSSFVNFGPNNRNVTDKITVEAWIKTTSANNQWVAGKYSNPEDKGYHLATVNGQAVFNGRDNSNLYKSSGFSPIFVNDGKWHHLAGVQLNGKWEIWVDGILENSATYPTASPDLTNSASLTIGNYHNNVNRDFTGEVDEIRIWNTGRTPNQIRENMCRKVNPAAANLVAYFKFDEGAGTTTADHSSFNSPGVLNSFPAGSWRTSGAAIGDESSALYATSWINKKLKLPVGNGDSLFVTNISNLVKGIHIYKVNLSPNSLTGIPNPSNLPNFYFGVFTTGTPNGTYDLHLKPSTVCNNNTIQIFKRQSNEVLTWQQNTLVYNVSTLTFEKQLEVYRQEYIIPNINNTPFAVKITGNLSFCAGSSTVLSVPGGNTYLWNNGQTTQNITVTTSGKYFVKVTSPSGCIGSDTVLVTAKPKPVADAGADKIICSGISSPIGSASIPGQTYSWTPATGILNSAIANPTVTLTNTTGSPITATYTVTVTQNGCISTDNVNVTVNPGPVALAGPDIVVCSGKDAQIGSNSNAGYTYLWSSSLGLSNPNISNPVINLVNQTIHPVIYTYNLTSTLNGCSTTDIVNITISPKPVAFAGDDRNICANENTTLGGPPNPDNTYLWSPVSGLSNPKVSNPVFSTKFLSISANNVFKYYVLVTNSTGCMNYDSVSVSIKTNQCEAGPKELFFYNIITPNHDTKNESFVIENLQYYPNNQLRIYNRWGQEIYNKKEYRNDWNSKNIADGTYYYVLILEDGTTYKGWFQVVR